MGLMSKEMWANGVGTFEAGSSHTHDPLIRSPDHTRAIDRIIDTEGSNGRVIPHPCIVCGGICYGPS